MKGADLWYAVCSGSWIMLAAVVVGNLTEPLGERVSIGSMVLTGAVLVTVAAFVADPFLRWVGCRKAEHQPRGWDAGWWDTRSGEVTMGQNFDEQSLSPRQRARLDQWARDAERVVTGLIEQSRSIAATGVEREVAMYNLATLIRDSLRSGKLKPDDVATVIAYMITAQAPEWATTTLTTPGGSDDPAG